MLFRSDKSIAVLPFRNLSSDPANAFFAEGIQDDILSRLVKIHDLRVISRLGTSRYPAGAPRDLHEIGRALGVRHIASLNGAMFLGREERIGSIATGKQADLVVIRGNPVVKMTDMDDVELVFRRGVGYDSAKLIAAARGLVGSR